MAGDFQSVCDAALALSEDERFLLVERLLESLPPPRSQIDDLADDEFDAELDRRAEELKRDPSQGVPWQDVFKDR
jgi:putative addiction module component (TIGR02574 family)